MKKKDADFAELGREGELSKGFPLIVALMRRGEDDERDTGINRQRKWEVLVTSVTRSSYKSDTLPMKSTQIIGASTD